MHLTLKLISYIDHLGGVQAIMNEFAKAGDLECLTVNDIDD